MIKANNDIIREVSVDFVWDPMVYGKGGSVDIWWGKTGEYILFPYHTEIALITYGPEGKTHNSTSIDLLKVVWFKSLKDRSDERWEDRYTDGGDICFRYGFGMPITCVYKVGRREKSSFLGEEKDIWGNNAARNIWT